MADSALEEIVAQARELLGNAQRRQFFRLALRLDRDQERKSAALALWHLALEHFWQSGNWRLIAHLYRRCGAYQPQYRRILSNYTHRVHRKPSAEVFDGLRRQFEQARLQLERTKILPPRHDLFTKPTDRPLEHFVGIRILCFFPLRSSRGVSLIFPKSLYETGRRFQLRADLLPLDEERKIGAPAYRYRALEAIERVRPDLVIVENNNPSDERAFSAEFVRDTKSRLKFQFGVIVSDAHSWAKHGAKFVYWRNTADKIIYHEPSFRPERSMEHQVFLTPGICDDAWFRDVGKIRDIPVSFTGALKSSRACWLAAAANSLVGLHLGRVMGGRGLVPDAYLDILQRSQIALSFGARESGAYLVTGRAWEIAYAGAALLEEEGSHLHQFFLPYVHYVPFSTANDLIDKCLYLQRYPDEAAAMARRANLFNAERYGPRQFWTRFLNSLWPKGAG